MFFELFADTGAKKRGPDLEGSLILVINPHEGPSVEDANKGACHAINFLRGPLKSRFSQKNGSKSILLRIGYLIRG